MYRFLTLCLLTLAGSISAETIELQPKTIQQIQKNAGISSPDPLQMCRTSDQDDCALFFQFDLATVPAARHGRVLRAQLLVDLAETDLPPAVEACLGILHLPKGDARTWFSGSWPKFGTEPGYYERRRITPRESQGNFAYATDPVARRPLPIALPDVLTFDVTTQINDILYSGKENNGMALSLSGAPANWKLQLARPPVLSVELGGSVPTSSPQQRQERTLRFYPSAHLPPVRTPYIFLWTAFGGEANRIFWEQFRVMNTDGVYASADTLNRGVLGLGAVYFRPNQWPLTKPQFLQEFRKFPLGFVIDEWQPRGNRKRGDAQSASVTPADHQVEAAIAAIRARKQENPATFAAVYWRGEDSLSPLAPEGLPDLVICEGYTSFTAKSQRAWEIAGIEQVKHLDWARQDGYLDRAIQLHGIIFNAPDYPDNDKVWTEDRLEHAIRTIREKYPESPGQGFYIELGKKDREKTIRQMLPLALKIDHLLHRYYVEPAPDVTIISPRYQETLHHPHVRIQVKATGRDHRTITRYRWFLDNRLVAESTEPELLWDLRGELNGAHIITVHAIDSAYYRSAAQLPVNIELQR